MSEREELREKLARFSKDELIEELIGALLRVTELSAAPGFAATPVPDGRAKVIQLLWEKQFEGSPWHSKFHLIRPDSLEKDYGALADTIIAALASPHSRPLRHQGGK